MDAKKADTIFCMGLVYRHSIGASEHPKAPKLWNAIASATLSDCPFMFESTVYSQRLWTRLEKNAFSAATIPSVHA